MIVGEHVARGELAGVTEGELDEFVADGFGAEDGDLQGEVGESAALVRLREDGGSNPPAPTFI